MADYSNNKQRQNNTYPRFYQFVFGAFFAFLLIVVLFVFGSSMRGVQTDTQTDRQQSDKSEDSQKTDEGNDKEGGVTQDDKHGENASSVSYPYKQEAFLTEINRDAVMLLTDESLHAEHIALLRVDDMTLLAAKEAGKRIHPASMTKVMTLLVACDHIVSLDEEVPVNGELFDKYANLLKGTEQFITYQYEKGCTMTVPMKTLLHLVGMESAADATLVLTDYLAGSHEEFVNWMNQKVVQLALRDTHFTNAIGIFDENLYSTVEDMALIMANAMQIDILVDMLGTNEIYVPFYRDGQEKSFLSRHTLFYDIYTKNTTISRKLANGYYVTAAKTGSESYYNSDNEKVKIKALVTMTTDSQKRQYVLVTIVESKSETFETLGNYLVSDLGTIFSGNAIYLKK